MQELIQAGNDLADFARGVAADAVEASGDVMDGSFALALAAAWHEAITDGARNGEATRMAHALGRAEGRQEGVAHRDELNDICDLLVRGFCAALSMGMDPDEIPDGREEPDMYQSLAEIDAATGAVARLKVLWLEDGGQQTLANPGREDQA
jgi:hypothetical protein